MTGIKTIRRNMDASRASNEDQTIGLLGRLFLTPDGAKSLRFIFDLMDTI